MKGRLGRLINIGVNGWKLEGELVVPPDATDVIVTVNGDWGVCYASRETGIAASLQRRDHGTLLIELLTPAEDVDRSSRFAVEQLADRLVGVSQWLDHDERTAGLNRGVIGVGPGGAVAIQAAAREEPNFGAVVSLDGRADLAEDALDDLGIPTLLIVDRSEPHVLEPNEMASERLADERHQLAVLRSDGTTPTNTLDTEVALLASNWFETHLPDGP